jgi:hypothetical protein
MKTLKLLFFPLLFAFPAFGQGTANLGPQYSVPIHPNTGTASAVGPSSISTDSTLNNLNVSGTKSNGGPNPYIETATYHMRAVTSVFQTTAICTGGSPRVRLAAASGFQNGDGIVLYGCGARNTLSTPGAPTVTPALMSGPDNMLDAVNAPSGGSTSYSYQIVARDRNGGLTAAGSAGTTSTGCTLGAKTSTVSTLSRSNNVVTVVTSAANGAAVGGIVFITQSTDSTFSGFFPVASVLSTTSFTYVQGMDTRAGASASATGGSAIVYNVNHLTWTAVSGAWQYYIYKSGTFVGISRPGENYWNDFGAAAPAIPFFVPSSAPVSATNDYLATTIVSGGGTANVVLATAALQTVTGATAEFDDGANLQNAFNACSQSTVQLCTVHISAPTAGTKYIFNSHVYLSPTGAGLTVIQSAPLALYETLEINPATNWSGEIGGPGTDPPIQFGYNPGMRISVFTAYPGMAVQAESSFKYLSFQASAPNAVLMTVGDLLTPFNFSLENSQFDVPSPDFVGNALVTYGITKAEYRHDIFTVGGGGSYGYSIGAGVLSRGDQAGVNAPGKVTFEDCHLGDRGFGTSNQTGNAEPQGLRFGNMYSQGPKTPLVMIGPDANYLIEIDRALNDSASMAYLANWSSIGAATISNVLQNSAESGGYPGIVTGSPITGLHLDNIDTGVFSVGQNTNLFRDFHGASMVLPIYGRVNSSDYIMASPLHFSPTYTLYWDLPSPTGLTAAPAAGGSLPVGTYTLSVTAMGADGGETTASTPATCTTTSGNRICNLAWSPVTGASCYNAYNVNSNVKIASCVTADTYSYTGFSCCNFDSPGDTGTGSTTIMSTQIITPQIVLSGPLSGAVSFAATIKGSFTASRNDTLPDASGTVSFAVDYACGATSTCAATPVIGARTFYGDATLASGSPSTVTITGFSPAFTSTSTFECTATDTTSRSALTISKVSTSSITITGPNTVIDDVSYICKGS